MQAIIMVQQEEVLQPLLLGACEPCIVRVSDRERQLLWSLTLLWHEFISWQYWYVFALCYLAALRPVVGRQDRRKRGCSMLTSSPCLCSKQAISLAEFTWISGKWLKVFVEWMLCPRYEMIPQLCWSYFCCLIGKVPQELILMSVILSQLLLAVRDWRWKPVYCFLKAVVLL